MKIAVISCSLHPQSRSFVLACAAHEDLTARGVTSQLLDLRDHTMEFAGSSSAWNVPDAKKIADVIRDSSAVLLAAPIYNWDVNAAAKNLLEVSSRAWDRKVVGFLCVAGGQSSYMSVMGLANSLMLDFRCIVVPRFVYATGPDFENDRQPNMTIWIGDYPFTRNRVGPNNGRLGCSNRSSLWPLGHSREINIRYKEIFAWNGLRLCQLLYSYYFGKALMVHNSMADCTCANLHKPVDHV